MTELQHGKRWTYATRGCRCDACRAAAREYGRAVRTGRHKPVPRVPNPSARFVPHPDDKGWPDCTVWPGRKATEGYGVLEGRPAHRVLWERANGPVPDGLELDHLCRNRACVNLAHLEPVTHQVNMYRSKQRWRDRTHCNRGHLITPENTYIDPTGPRYCRQCRRENDRRREPRVRR